MANYNTQLQSNNTDLQTVLQTLQTKAAGEGEPTLINFTIKVEDRNSPTIYNVQAEENMNWGMWLYSEYNPLLQNVIKKSGRRFCIEPLEHTVMFMNDVMASTFQVNGTDVLTLDNIIPNHIYDVTYIFNTCCFIAGTQVLTDLNGHSKPIEDFTIGDEVVSYNVETGENYITKVNRTIIHENTTDIAEVTFDNGATVTMNAYHPLYTDKGWHSITNYNNYDTLIIGDNIKTIDGWTKILNIKRYTSEPIITYNIDVIDINEIHDINYNDNYYANGIVAHNPYC